MELTRKQLSKYLDHTLLAPYATKEEMVAFCKECIELDVKMAAINSAQVKTCKEVLKDTDIHVGAAISFPFGQTTIPVKVFETKTAIEDGADEIDYVIHIGKAKEHDYAYLKEEMSQMVKTCHAYNVPCKVIIETCYLTKEEIKQLCLIAKEVKPDFVKTSTGFGTDGATVENVKLMLETVDGECGIKAAGHIRDYETCMTMINLGCTRIGTRSSRIILDGYDKEHNK